MIKLHPAIIHFPMALLICSAIFGFLSLFVKKETFRVLAFWNLIAGLISSLAAVISGLLEEQILIHNETIHQILKTHKFIGIFLLIYYSFLSSWSLLRKKLMSRREYSYWITCLLIGATIVIYQGYLGGIMVFEHGAGVKPMEYFIESEKYHIHH